MPIIKKLAVEESRPADSGVDQLPLLNIDSSRSQPAFKTVENFYKTQELYKKRRFYFLLDILSICIRVCVYG